MPGRARSIRRAGTFRSGRRQCRKGSKAIYSPTKKLDVKAQADWDNENDTIAYSDLSVFYKLTEKFRLGGGYLSRDYDLYDYGASPWDRVKDNLI